MSSDKNKNKVYLFSGKRIFDLSLTIPAIIVLTPILVVVALLVLVRLGRPVLFKQVRPGIEKKPFLIFKFRTMTDMRNKEGILLPDTERLTCLGTFLRRTSIDELPELFNVLKGDMSLVGPRPLLMRYINYFTQEESIRFTVRPGITGIAQISGRNDLNWDMRLLRDIQYVKSISLGADLKILFLTALRVLTKHGVCADPRAAMLDLDEERRERL